MIVARTRDKSPGTKPAARLLAAGISALVLAACQTTGGGSIETTYERADVRVPGNIIQKYDLDFRAAYEQARATMPEDAQPNFSRVRLEELGKHVPSGTKLPVIAYFHGCAGLVIASRLHLDWLEKLDDFVTIAPNSFARKRPTYCFRNQTVDVSLTGIVTDMRKAEIRYALDQIVKLPWVDTRNIFLIGHSQGGGTVAGYGGPVSIRGRVLLNGGCNEFLGGNAIRDGEAVLSFDSGRDRWFVRYATYCRSYALGQDGGQSVYDETSASHNLVLDHWDVLEKFLKDNRR